MNNSERIRWVGSGEEYIVTTDVSCDGSDRDIEKDMPARKFLTEFIDENFTRILQGFPRFEPFQRSWY